MKIRSVGAELLHADRHYEAKSHFSRFCERASKGKESATVTTTESITPNLHYFL
jgi:hypothetical protein